MLRDDCIWARKMAISTRSKHQHGDAVDCSTGRIGEIPLA